MKKIGYYILKFLLDALSHLPLKVHYVLADGIAWLVRCVVRYRVDVVRNNLALSFPEKTEEERKQILKDFYTHFAELVAEVIWFRGSRPDTSRLRDADLVEEVNPELMDEAYDCAPSVEIVMGHSGNWELIAGYLSFIHEGVKCRINEGNFSVVYKKMTSPVWNQLMKENRLSPLYDKNNPGYVESNQLLRYILSHKDEKKFYFLNTDQRPYKAAKGVVTVDFMNQECHSMVASANIAVKFDFAVLYQSMQRDRRGHYTLRYIPITMHASEMTPEAIMQKFYNLLEADLRACPANYLWTHKRWKK